MESSSRLVNLNMYLTKQIIEYMKRYELIDVLHSNSKLRKYSTIDEAVFQVFNDLRRIKSFFSHSTNDLHNVLLRKCPSVTNEVLVDATCLYYEYYKKVKNDTISIEKWEEEQVGFYSAVFKGLKSENFTVKILFNNQRNINLDFLTNIHCLEAIFDIDLIDILISDKLAINLKIVETPYLSNELATKFIYYFKLFQNHLISIDIHKPVNSVLIQELIKLNQNSLRKVTMTHNALRGCNINTFKDLSLPCLHIQDPLDKYTNCLSEEIASKMSFIHINTELPFDNTRAIVFNKLTYLKRLELKFTRDQEELVIRILKAISSSTTMESLSLQFSDYCKQSQFFCELFSSLKRFQNLSSFSYQDITAKERVNVKDIIDIGVSQISDILAKGKEFLVNIYNRNWKRNIHITTNTLSGIVQLADILKMNPKISSFTLMDDYKAYRLIRLPFTHINTVNLSKCSSYKGYKMLVGISFNTIKFNTVRDDPKLFKFLIRSKTKNIIASYDIHLVILRNIAHYIDNFNYLQSVTIKNSRYSTSDITALDLERLVIKPQFYFIKF